MKEMKESERAELIERAMDDIHSNLYEYHDWIMEEMKNVVESWDEKELKDFLGEGEESEE